MSTDPASPQPASTPDAAAKPRREAPSDGLCIIGLVGRAGSGKSTVARALVSRGAILMDADRIGHLITDSDPEVRQALIAEYGPQVYRTSGPLDRGQVAARVFTDAEALQRLNRLVHPRILAHLRTSLGALRARGARGPVVIDAALMIDWGFERECDALWAVVAPESLQIGRLVGGRGLTEADARARLSRQRTNAEFAAAADEVLVNDGSESQLEALAQQALARALERRGRA